MRFTSVSRSSASVSALIVQESIARSPAWSNRLANLDTGLALIRLHDVRDLARWYTHSQISIAIVEKAVLEDDPLGYGSSPRMRSLRPIARIDGAESPAELERLLLFGCCGFVHDRVSGPSLMRTLRAVAAGEIAASRKLLSSAVHRLLAGVAAPKLTKREQEVLSLIGQRLTNKRIADQLFISGETLRWHLRNLYSKTDLQTRSELLEYARAMGPGNRIPRADSEEAGGNVVELRKKAACGS